MSASLEARLRELHAVYQLKWSMDALRAAARQASIVAYLREQATNYDESASGFADAIESGAALDPDNGGGT